MSEQERQKRLTLLIQTKICCDENASTYSKELKELAEKVADIVVAKKSSKFFKALADETRLRILDLLEVREMCVCEIMVALGLTQPTASHHLGILENAGVVKDRKDGKWVFYSVRDPRLMKNINKLNPVQQVGLL
jgi:DNA-binding transcriptional ArsR family regulator